MKTILGFITRAGWINNDRDQVNPLYEISPKGLTYSRDRGEYSSLTYPGDTLHTFKTVDTDTGESFVVPAGEVNTILDVNMAAYNYWSNAGFPINIEDFGNTISAQMADKITNFQFGEVVITATRASAKWMSWRSLAPEAYETKVWLANEEFETQYPDFEIVIVPPVENLDRFFGVYQTLADEIRAITPGKMNDLIQEVRGDKPDTVTRWVESTFINSSNPQDTTTVTWGALIYGAAGDNPDSIKDALIDYVLNHSTRDQQEWEVVMPDLFQRTEFVLKPRWDLISIPNLTTASALYSSIMSYQEVRQHAGATWSLVPPSFIDEKLFWLPFDYKSLSVIGIPGTTNPNHIQDLRALYPDYIPVHTGSVDFNRMSIKTREWVLQMVELLKTAETATLNQRLPFGIRRVIRNDVVHVARVIDNVNYLTITRLQA